MNFSQTCNHSESLYIRVIILLYFIRTNVYLVTLGLHLQSRFEDLHGALQRPLVRPQQWRPLPGRGAVYYSVCCRRTQPQTKRDLNHQPLQFHRIGKDVSDGGKNNSTHSNISEKQSGVLTLLIDYFCPGALTDTAADLCSVRKCMWGKKKEGKSFKSRSERSVKQWSESSLELNWDPADKSGGRVKWKT